MLKALKRRLYCQCIRGLFAPVVVGVTCRWHWTRASGQVRIGEYAWCGRRVQTADGRAIEEPGRHLAYTRGRQGDLFTLRLLVVMVCQTWQAALALACRGAGRPAAVRRWGRARGRRHACSAPSTFSLGHGRGVAYGVRCSFAHLPTFASVWSFLLSVRVSI